MDLTPSFLEAGERATVALTGPNERDEPMTGFRVRVPGGMRIAGGHGPYGWSLGQGEAAATWSGGSLAAGSEATFQVELEAPQAPGAAELEVDQLYPGGEVVSWTVALTVVPATDTPGQNLGLALVVAILGLLLTAGIVGFSWYRRTRSLQER